MTKAYKNSITNIIVLINTKYNRVRLDFDFGNRYTDKRKNNGVKTIK